MSGHGVNVCRRLQTGNSCPFTCGLSTLSYRLHMIYLKPVFDLFIFSLR